MNKPEVIAAAEPPVDGGVRGWQPIESAPKDGTSIIVCSDTGNVWCNVKWEKRPRAGERWEHFTLGAIRFTPTYWMPIPKAPNVEVRGGALAPSQRNEVERT